jgi:predicted GTPase
MTASAELSLSLVSHTNVGKTTLARTLLGRDIGEVRDEAHVTETAEPHRLIDSPAGDRLLLWDTPGFGDSHRLAKRLAMAGNPLGWLLTEAWDRWRDRAFWASQRAIRHVLDQADVALYLVNAAEAPDDAAYLAPELQVLALLGKPVVVVLNQLGAPGDEARQVQRWQAHLAGLTGQPGMLPSPVRAVLPLDAFARCWVQEGVLLQAVAEALPDDRRPAMGRLIDAWRQRQQATWQASMAVLAQRLGRAALDRERVASGGWRAPLRRAGQLLGRGLSRGLGLDPGRPGDDDSAQNLAMAALADRLDADIRRSTAALIALHGLQGDAAGEVLARLAQHFSRREPVSEGRAAIWGGIVTGALAGLKADLASGGLTMGGGLLAGGVLGALGAAGAARGVNRVRGIAQPVLAWDDRVLDALLRSALLAYLAVAHHGRGRGEWRQGEPPAAWISAVDAALAQHQADRDTLWQLRAEALAVSPAGVPSDVDDEGRPVSALPAAAAAATPAFDDALASLGQALGRSVLRQLYPDGALRAGL